MPKRGFGAGAGALIAKFKPTGPTAGFMPMLRAYSGFRHKDSRDFSGPDVLGRLGSLEVRLARTAADVRRAQKLRFRVFYQEMAAIADAKTTLARRDVDGFDALCDHLLVLDHAEPKMVFGRPQPRVVGTYRLLRQTIAQRHGGFYTAGEFDIADLVARHGDLNFLELGRSCVLKPYRNKRTVELLWHGIWTYVLRHGIDAMIGCASLEGTDIKKLALPLSFLHHSARAPEAWRARAVASRFVDMNILPANEIDGKAALKALPPLVKGYLRLGGYIGEGAVIDRQFNTTDVLVILPRTALNPRYVSHFGESADRHAAA